MPEIEELRQALESGDVSDLLNDKEEEVMIASSLVHIPTYIKDPSKLPPDVLAMMLQNKQTYDFILENFPDALKDIHSAESLQMKTSDKKKPQEDAKNTESKSVKLKRRVSSLIKGQKSILKKDEIKDVETGQGQTPKRNPEKVVDLESLKVRRQSISFRRTQQNTSNSSKYHIRSSSCPDIYKNSMMEEEEKAETFYSEMIDSFKECLSLHYVTLPFVVFCISNFLLYFW